MNTCQKNLLLLQLCFLFACTSKISKSLIAETDNITVACSDLDKENWQPGTIEDVVLTKYTLVSFTKENKVHDQKSGIYGPDVFDSTGQFRIGFESIAITVPAKGHLVMAVSLQEDNDPSILPKFLLDPQFLADIILFTKDTSSRAPGLNPFWLRVRMLKWNEELIPSVDVLSSGYEFLAAVIVIENQKLKRLENKKISSYLDTSPLGRKPTCHYTFNYRIGLHKPLKIEKNDNGKAQAPNFIVSFYPFITNGKLNKYWINSLDPFYSKDPENENRYVFGEGLYNKELAIDVSVPISPQIHFGSGTSSRFHMLMRYSRHPYFADLDNQEYYLHQDNYFSIPKGETLETFTIDNIELDFTSFQAAPHFKIYTPILAFDIGGGLVYANAKIRFQNLSIENPNIQFIYNEKTNILEKNVYPFGFVSAGLGRTSNGHGFLLNISTSFHFPNFTPNDNYQIFQNISESELIPLSPDSEFLMYWHLGFSFLF